MSGVRAASQFGAEDPKAELEIPEMVDMLYDIVATGVETGGRVSVEQIEQFLHEHARAARSLEEFHAFFDTHGIEVRGQTEPRIPLRVLEPVPNAEAPVAPVLDVSPETVEAAMLPPTLPGMLSPDAAVAALDTASFRRWALGAGLAATLALSVVGWAMMGLRTDLRDARAMAEHTQLTLEQRTAQQAALEANLAQNRELIEQLKSQNETLLDNLLPSPVLRRDLP